MIQQKHFNDIMVQMQSFRKADFLCDIALITNDRQFRAHSVVLAAASSVFRETLKQTSDIESIQLTGFDSVIVETALEVMYGGRMNLPDVYRNVDKLGQLFASLQELGLDIEKLNNCEINFLGVDEACAEVESHENELAVRSDSGQDQVLMDVDSDHSSLDDIQKNTTDLPQKISIDYDPTSSVLKTDKHILVAPITDYHTPVKFCKPLGSSVKSTTTVCESPLASRIEFPLKITESEKTFEPSAGVRCSDSTNLKINVKSGKVQREKTAYKVDRALMCVLCNKAFSQPNHLRIHMRTHNGNRPYSCAVCYRRFSQSANLLRHEQMHTGERPHLCDICGRSFIQKITLSDHMVSEHSSTSPIFSCKLCPLTFDKRKQLTNHVRENHRVPTNTVRVNKASVEKPYACGTCYKLYTTLGALRMHMRVHDGTMFACDLCDKSYVNAALLRQHSATHSGEKEFVCATCGKAFIYRNALFVHRRTHTGEKPYKCMVCGHAYAQYGHLQSHAKTHTGKVCVTYVARVTDRKSI